MLKEIGSNIWQVDGSEAGPLVVVLGGVHGNEKTGIEVVKKLRGIFKDGERKILCGRLILALGNEEAIGVGSRETNGHNLNRLFTSKHLSKPPEDFYESRRAHELAPLLGQADILLDIHATYNPSPAFLASAVSSRHELVYRWFDTEVILTDPNFIVGDGRLATTDEFVDSCGGIGICFEAGWMEDASLVPSVLRSVMAVLADQGLVEPAKAARPPERSYEIYEIIRKIILTESGFHFTKKEFIESFCQVKNQEVIGYHGDRPEIAEMDGILVFQKNEAQQRVGRSVFFLAKQIK